MAPTDYELVKFALQHVPLKEMRHDAQEALDAIEGRVYQADVQRLSLWLASDLARARGLAEALAHPIGSEVRKGSTEEIAAEIVKLLSVTREEFLAGPLAPDADSSPSEESEESRLLYTAWTIIANANEGRWEDLPQEWVDAAVRWRDDWHAWIGKQPDAQPVPG